MGAMNIHLARVERMHLDDIRELYKDIYHDPVDPEALESAVGRIRNVVAYDLRPDGAHVLVGFIVRKQVAPDIVGWGTLVIRPEYRGAGIGSSLVETFDRWATEDGYGGVVVVNSMLYSTTPPKKPGEQFWVRCGYHVVARTDDTVLFFNNL